MGCSDKWTRLRPPRPALGEPAPLGTWMDRKSFPEERQGGPGAEAVSWSHTGGVCEWQG